MKMNDISLRPTYLSNLGVEGNFADTRDFIRPPKISMLGDAFTPLDENDEAVLPKAFTLSVIMLRENPTRILWPKREDGAYDRASTPVCFSDNRLTPSEGAARPQSVLCSNCPKAERNQPGFSGKTLVSACKQHYKVAVLVENAGKKVFLLDITPASIKPYNQYLGYLKTHNAKPEQVITKLGYVNKTFTFTFWKWVTEDAVEPIQQLLLTDEPAMVVNAFDKPRQTALPKPETPYVATQITPAQELPPQTIEDPPTGALTPFGVALSSGRPPDPPKRGPGRPRKDPGETVPASSAVSPTPPQSGSARPSNFGMEPAEAPDAAMQKALFEAFGR